VKKPEDAASVRDEILKTFAKAASEAPDAKRLADAKSNARYGLARRFDNTEQIAAMFARFVRYGRSAGTLNRLYRVSDSLTPADLQAVARKYFTDAGLVVTTLSKDPLPAAAGEIPALTSFAPGSGAAGARDLKLLLQKSELPQLDMKLVFSAGSAHDPKGKEGLAALSASMIAEAGSKDRRIDEI